MKTIANARKRKLTNLIAILVMVTMLVVCLIPLVSVSWTLLSKGIPAISLDFLTNLPLSRQSGIGNAILGSLLILLVASCFAIPFGLLVGMYLSQCPSTRLATPTRTLLDVMSGIPAIVVGMFIYTMVVLPMKSYSMMAGGVSLAMIMLPIFARTSEEALKSIPETVMEAGLGLGLPRWRVVLQVLLRSALPGVLTGFFLALARVGGEAAPLLFTVGGSNFWPSHSPAELVKLQPLTEQVASLPLVVYEYAKDPRPAKHEAAWGAALVLVVIILAIRLGTHAYVRWRYGQQGAR
jgi:phosphate transport system permease protein